MSKNQLSKISILDCSLRDGGYYTDWDFDDDLINSYFSSLNNLPVEYLEIGYRSVNKKEYAGAYYYLPIHILEDCRRKSNKKLAVILNEKEITEDNVCDIIAPCKAYIDLVRLAVSPKNLDRGIATARIIRSMGFKVAINLMYASNWDDEMLHSSSFVEINDLAEYFYVVDSYGGLLPEDVTRIFEKVKSVLDIPIGFHGHNNLELALANSLAAINSGASIIDCTISGMGRGAGNLSTELLLTLLNKTIPGSVDLDILYSIAGKFKSLKLKHQWGTNLPFMVSGIYSLPQDTIISQVNKRYYSLNSYVKDITNIGNISENVEVENFVPIPQKQVLIVGGGNTPKQYGDVLDRFLRNNNDILIIYSSSKNVEILAALENYQIHCLPGREAKRLETFDLNLTFNNRTFIIPPHGNYTNIYLPASYLNQVNRLDNLFYMKKYVDSSTAMAIDIAIKFSPEVIYFTGFDGYDDSRSKDEKELFEENQQIFDELMGKEMKIFSLTPTQYNIPLQSIYTLL